MYRKKARKSISHYLNPRNHHLCALRCNVSAFHSVFGKAKTLWTIKTVVSGNVDYDILYIIVCIAVMFLLRLCKESNFRSVLKMTHVLQISSRDACGCET